MNSREIIADAWNFTRNNKKLMWAYSFVPSLLTTLIGIIYLLYQYFAFKRSPLFDDAEISFLTEVISFTIDFIKNIGGLAIPAIIIVAIILILYALLPTLLQGSLIQIIARKRKGETIRAIEGVSLGLLVFLPLLEYHLLVKSFSLFSVFTEAGFIARNLGGNWFKILLPVFIIYAIIGFILSLLFTYSEFFIVLGKKSVLRSMGRSVKLVIMSWQHTFIIGILMLIIGLRIAINIVAVLLVPALLFFAAGLIATVTLATVGIVVGIIVSLVGLIVAAYFSGILNLFSNAVWTFTYMELMKDERVKEIMGE